MIEALKNMDWIAFGSAVAGIITALAGLVAGIIAIRNSKRISQALEEAKARETFTVCPNCKKKIPLSEINWHLPTGEVDNNLNGKPDYLE